MPQSQEPASRWLGEAAVGNRLTVRLLAGGVGPSGGPAMRDIVGTLESKTAGPSLNPTSCWLMRRKDGTVELVVVDTIVAVKVLSGPPPTSDQRSALGISDLELEQIAAKGWQPLASEQLGGWTLRASGGFTGRANSVLPLGDPGLDVENALQTVRDWYLGHDLPALFQVPLPLAVPLDDGLSTRGWMAFNPTLVMVADIAALLMQRPTSGELARVQFHPEPSAAWLRTYNYRGKALPVGAREVMVNADQPVFASLVDQTQSRLVAVARGAIYKRWLGITAVDVIESERRKGHASRLMAALFAHAQHEGVRHVYLQVAEDNQPALTLYEGLGFTAHHRYHYRRATKVDP